jgi:glycosyltransferase involved in cell wall biosynthesis
MVRVCMVAYTHYPADSRVRREAEALIERGDTVDMICLGERNEADLDHKNGVRIFRILLPRYRGSNSIKYLTSYWIFFWAALIKLARLQIKNSYQVIQVHTMPDFMVFTTIIPKLLGAKIILDVHDLMPELYQSKFGSKNKHPLISIITWIERCSIGFAHRAIAVHQPHLEALCRHGNPSQKFIILLNVPDTKIFTNQANIQQQDHSGLKLIYHGTVAKRNGLEIAIRALSTLSEDLKDLKLRIIGDGDDILRLSDLVVDLGLQDKVQINHGVVLIEELIPIIQEADIGIVPILYDDFTKYMLPVKLLEYVALGKPVICSRTETIETYFDDSMVLFTSPGSVSDLAQAIRFLYEHPERRLDLITKSNKFKQMYNWEKQKLIYYSLIDSLVNGKLFGEPSGKS